MANGAATILGESYVFPPPVYISRIVRTACEIEILRS
jgi:hypothetical protein